MKQKLHCLLPLLWCCLLAAPFASCDDSEKFTAQPGALLTFSTDTVKFDTVLSTIGSATRQLMVYNRNAEGLRIVKARMHSASATPFRVNVDGTYLERQGGAVAYDFEVRTGDSIRVFAEVTMPYADSDQLRPLCDTLIFTLESGVEQGVIFSAVAQDAYMWRGKTIHNDTTLLPGRPVLVYDSLVVAPGVTLTLQAGVALYFHDDAHLLVDGTLVAQGTAEQPVVLRCDRTDRMFPYLPYDNTPSRWGGVRLRRQSMNNVLEHIDLHSASYGICCDSASLEAPRLSLLHSVIHNVGGDGLTLYSCRALVANTQVSNTLGHCVAAYGGELELTHCTLAQFYPWDANRGYALRLADKWVDKTYTLLGYKVQNCLVTGYADNVVSVEIDDKEGTAPYLFDHSVVRMPATDDEKHYTGMTFEAKDDEHAGSKQFRRLDIDNIVYDFRLLDTSTARGKGSAALVGAWTADRYGVARPADAAPDAGCYQYVTE